MKMSNLFSRGDHRSVTAGFGPEVAHRKSPAEHETSVVPDRFNGGSGGWRVQRKTGESDGLVRFVSLA
jgi:hypothetical protein